MAEADTPSVRRRQVFYIPGYDPHPPRRYRELFRTEAAKQADISGFDIEVTTGEDRRVAWEASALIEGARVQTRYEVLEWSDIVRGTMSTGLPGTYLQLLKVARVYIFSGALARLSMLRKGPIIAGFYPVLALLAQLVLALIAGTVVAGILTGALGQGADAAFGLLGWAPVTPKPAWGVVDWLLGWVIFGGVAWLVLTGFRAIDGKLFAHYLMHDLAYAVKDAGAYPAELEDRIDAFADRIAAALADDVDEVLVVGHSSGAQLGVSAVARLLREDCVSEDDPALALLTLGEAIPMTSFLPKATALRRDLHDIAGSDVVTWVDVSAPGDGCCFALCDPVGVSGVAPDTQRWPLVISAAFSQTLSEDMQAALRRRWFRLHFQYLCAFDRPRDYDYFRVTAGPLTLGERFAGRKPSVNRIDIPASGFRSMAA